MLSHCRNGAAEICGDGESVTKRNWDRLIRETVASPSALDFLYVVGSAVTMSSCNAIMIPE